MLEKITIGVVPSSVVQGRRMTEELLRDVETELHDAVARVYGSRTDWWYEPEWDGRRYGILLGGTSVHYEIMNSNGEVQAQVGVEGECLDQKQTGTFLRAILEDHEVREKEGDAHAEHTSHNGTEIGQKALEMFNVRVTTVIMYKDGGYHRTELSGSATR